MLQFIWQGYRREKSISSPQVTVPNSLNTEHGMKQGRSGAGLHVEDQAPLKDQVGAAQLTGMAVMVKIIKSCRIYPALHALIHTDIL